jgi:hypothetical protein
MDPEQEIALYLRSKGVQHAVLKDMLDQFAHNLAEAIRREITSTYDDWGADAYRGGALAAADLIDPEVSGG